MSILEAHPLYPHFTVARVVTDAEGTCLIGTASSLKFGREQWINDGWLGFLKIESVLIKGRWRRIGQSWEFRLSHQTDVEWMEKFSELEVLDVYWGERAEIALNEKRHWKRSAFKATAGCDHYHCEICWAKIWEPENREFMKSQDNVNICLSCYERVVIPRSLEFIRYVEDPDGST